MPPPRSTPLQTLVTSRLEALGRTPFEAAESAGLNRVYLYEIITGGKRSIRSEFFAQVAQAIEVPVEEVVAAATRHAPTAPVSQPAGGGGTGILEKSRKRLTPREPQQEIRMADVPYPSYWDLARNLPVYGTAAGSMIGEFESFSLDTVDIVDMVMRPPALAQVGNAYAVYIVGESMVPAHEPGDLRFVHPGKAPRHGDTVIIQTRNGEYAPFQCFIKRFLKTTPKGILVEQFNPVATMEFMRETIIAVHKVLTMAELFGL